MACFCYGGMEWAGLGQTARMAFAEPDAEPNYGPSRTVQIRHIDIKLRIDPEAQRFEGRAEIAFEPLPDFDGRVDLDLDDVDVSDVTSADGNPLDWRHNGDVLEVHTGPESRALVVEWVGGASGRGMYFTGPERWATDRQAMAWTQCQDEDGHFVFPCHDHPRQKHTWSIELEAPVGYTLLSNGEQLEQGERDGWNWARFRQSEPMPAYLFTAVAAKLTCIEAEWRGRAVRYFVPVGEESAVARSMGKTPLMIEHFSQLLGVDYPWPRYDQVVVHDFVFGGMENTACTTMTDILLVPEEAIDHWDPDGLVAHELAHQWFGDFVTCQDWSQGWLNESWATFMETQWWEADRSESEATWYRYRQANGYWAEGRGRYQRPIVAYRFKEPIDVFDRHLYEKGSCVLSTLRHELGDAAFWSGVKTYLSEHGHDTVHTRHFQRAMEARSGRNLDGFFDQWIYSPGHPVVTVDLSAKHGMLLAKVTQTQKGDGVPEAYSFQLLLEVVFASGEVKTFKLPVQSRERTFALPAEERIQTVRVDPGFRVLADISIKAKGAWLEHLTRDKCPVLADRAARALLKMDGVKPFRVVCDAIHSHPSPRVRASVVGRLARRGGEEVKETLLTALGEESDPVVVLALVAGLSRYRTVDVVEAFGKLLERGDLTHQLHGRLLEAIGQTRHATAVELIRPHLETGSWAEVIQRGALLGLASTRNTDVMDILVSYSSIEHKPRIRAAAAAALARIGDEVESTRSEAGEALIEMLRGNGFREVLAAMAALATLRDSKAIEVLSELHQRAPDGRVRRMAYEAMVIIQRGHKTAEGLETLRSRFDKLNQETAKLRSRLERVERVED